MDISLMTRRQITQESLRILESIPSDTPESRRIVYDWSTFNRSLEVVEIARIGEGESIADCVSGVQNVLAWCDSARAFHCMSRNGYCRTCAGRRSGLGNPAIHKMTIDRQIERGTFNMMNPEVQKNKVSNENLRYDLIYEVCEVHGRTQHKKWGKTLVCLRCASRNNGARYRYCKQCDRTTVHNGSVCTECYPEAACVDIGNTIQEMDGVEWIRVGDAHVPWEDYKKDFESRVPGDAEPRGGVILPTFWDESNGHWGGGQGAALQKLLVDHGIGWFAYIKYVRKPGGSIPIVAGKSGSTLVNGSGCDLSFSTDPDDGPARRMIKELGFTWETDYWAVFPCETEQEAYALELELQREHGLLGS